MPHPVLLAPFWHTLKTARTSGRLLSNSLALTVPSLNTSRKHSLLPSAWNILVLYFIIISFPFTRQWPDETVWLYHQCVMLGGGGFVAKWLFHDPMDYSLSDSSVHGISQARILKWDPPAPPSPGQTRPPGVSRLPSLGCGPSAVAFLVFLELTPLHFASFSSR